MHTQSFRLMNFFWIYPSSYFNIAIGYVEYSFLTNGKHHWNTNFNHASMRLRILITSKGCFIGCYYQSGGYLIKFKFAGHACNVNQ